MVARPKGHAVRTAPSGPIKRNRPKARFETDELDQARFGFGAGFIWDHRSTFHSTPSTDGL